MVPKGAMQASRAWRQPTVLPSLGTNELQQCLTWHDNTKGMIVAHIQQSTAF